MVTFIAGPHTLGGPDSSFYLLLFFRWLIKHRLDIVFQYFNTCSNHERLTGVTMKNCYLRVKFAMSYDVD
jgi:hypothetical protein